MSTLQKELSKSKEKAHHQLLEEIDVLKDRVALSESKYLKELKKNGELDREKASLSKDLIRAQEQIHHLNQDSMSQKELSSKKNADTAILQSKLDSTVQELDSSKRLNTQLQHELQQVICKLEQTETRLNRDLSDAKKEYDASIRNQENLRDQVHRQSNQISDLMQLKAKIALLEQQYAEKARNYNQAMEENLKLKEEISKLSCLKNEMLSKASSQDEELNALYSDLGSAKETIESLQAVTIVQRDKIENLENEISDIEDNSKNEYNQQESKLARLHLQIHKLEKQVKDHENDKQRALDSFLEKQDETLKRHSKKYEEDYNILKQQYDTELKSRDSQRSKLQELQYDLEEANDRIGRRDEKIHRLEDTISSMQVSIDEEQEKTASWEDKYQKLDNDFSNYHSKFLNAERKFKEKYNSLHSQLLASQKSHATLRNQVVEKDQVISTLKSKDSENEECLKTVEANIKDLMQQLISVRSDYDSLKEEYDALSASYDDTCLENDQLNEKITQMIKMFQP
eukprot:CAMPEP_0117423038 /NCGR_PEP_ID=MMETSP0758-20121206/3759_1 /TAXON_ID=63605 /ORGANISM="Percolomonas cosmopolitus, Strain AE-1 (ATCC 50343)" /LENGTH=514 /DNA_ID=CAMNT_0005206021 /DNA_START=615 /DNA_END=2159 /DNA_ORIENTATION=-